jgi:hypothetical protein
MATKKRIALVPLPPLAAAWEVTRLELTRVVRGKALRAAVVIAGLLVVAATISCLAGARDSLATFAGSVRSLFPWLAIALSMLFAARVISDDVDAGVIHYWFMLPSPRWAVTVGKYLCSAAVVTGVLVGSTVLLYLGTHIAEPGLVGSHAGDLGRAVLAMLGAGLSYTAVFLFLGAAVADLPYLLPLIHVAVLEVGAGSSPVLEIASIRHHVGVVLGTPAQVAADETVDTVLETLGLVTPEVPLWASLLVMAIVFASGLALGVIVTEFSEYRTGKP